MLPVYKILSLYFIIVEDLNSAMFLEQLIRTNLYHHFKLFKDTTFLFNKLWDKINVPPLLFLNYKIFYNLYRNNFKKLILY